jgi:flagellar protein FliO/FliZ
VPHSVRASAVVHVAAAAGHGSTGAQSVSASSLLIQMVVGLVVVVVLIKLASRFVRGRNGPALGRARQQGAVAVVGRQSLGKGVHVAMVMAGQQKYLLGVTQRQVTLLGQVEADEIVVAEAQDPAVGALQLLPGGNELTSAAGAPGPVWKSAIEQMRARTLRRA